VRVVAEGIEDADGVEVLSDLGIRFGQGFHLGRPAPLDEALALS
jgi:EAL domain-containing protein (putative c-di-GMP-specific phosphodiesterase class I)